MTVPVELDLDALSLERGAHDSPEDGMCMMEAVAYIADEPFSDRPECASPVLGSFLRGWNDQLDHEDRQRLKPYIPEVVGTADDGQDDERAWLLVDYLIRTYTPAWLDLAGLDEHAAALREHPRIDSEERVASVTPLIQPAKQDAWGAAGGAAWGAAGAAAWGAAWDALEPTVEELQAHVWDELLPALIDPSEAEDGDA